MITHTATLDVARPIGQYLAQLLADERARRGTRTGRRALSVWRHAVLVLRWLRQAPPVRALALDNGISVATAYRYLHEGITVLAVEAPDLPEVLAQRLAAGDTHVILDGTLIRTTRVAGKIRKTRGRTAGTLVHRWYSGKHRAFGGNIQFLATAGGFPLWCSDPLPGTVNDLTAARTHGLIGPLCAAAAQGLTVLADKAYHAAGIGIRTPFKTAPGNHPLQGHPLHIDQRTHNTLHNSLRALGERAAALLKTRWKALQRVTLSPSHIGTIIKAALVLTQLEHQGRY
ncbi:transposase family protein [Amycolatopsis magusensis]|uniref:transposase family protein n=1 Tax=Amycolatopsis magusensis TaxID=882444 RepID=UPI0024A9C7F3|nr:transposase family protein [Amycolatopsis magusensis]MDI5982246.1 transposase family protein [Amycolatopsis magusensis]